MIKKFFEIIRSWAISFYPSQKRKEIAQERLKICNECEYNLKGECGWCGCPIDKKIYSPLKGENACPLQKWIK